MNLPKILLPRLLKPQSLPRTLLCHSYQSLPSAERCSIACCSISTSSVRQSDSSQQLRQAKVPLSNIKGSSQNDLVIPKDYALQINGLAEGITKDMLQDYFSRVGTVLDCRLVTTSDGCCAEVFLRKKMRWSKLSASSIFT
uniref:RRM domain-containing protein n=1 Tax=Ditylenchus dipsaci TaxID=166011 RepID=A0A915EPE4_9BILA